MDFLFQLRFIFSFKPGFKIFNPSRLKFKFECLTPSVTSSNKSHFSMLFLIYSHCLLVSLHRFRLAPSIQPNSKDAIKHCHSFLHSELSSAQFCGKSTDLLPLLSATHANSQVSAFLLCPCADIWNGRGQ